MQIRVNLNIIIIIFVINFKKNIMYPHFTVPVWVKKYWFVKNKESFYPENIFEDLHQLISKINVGNPVVSIGIVAYNEEKNILRSIASLANQKTKYPFEIIYVDNNSTDNTKEIMEKTGVKVISQPQKGIPKARQAALEAAKGKFHLSGDADCIYPPYWIEEMMKKLEEEGVAGVYGRVAFYSHNYKTFRLGFVLYEIIKYWIHDFRGINRPELSVCANSFGFIKEYADKIGGWNISIKRGSDGYMAWKLKDYGKIIPVRTEKSLVWTVDRSLTRDGNLFVSTIIRIWKELSRIPEYLTKQKGEYVTKDSNKLK